MAGIVNRAWRSCRLQAFKSLLVFTVLIILALQLVASTIPHHVDIREVADEIPYAPDLLFIYSSIIDFVRAEDYSNAIEKLREVINVYVPENIKYVFSRFNELLNSEVQLLNETNLNINYAYKFYVLGFIDDSRRCLDEASLTLAKANLTHNELEAACIQLSKRIPLRQLLDKLGNLKSIINSYWIEIRDLWYRLTYIGEIYETRLTIQVDKYRVWVGSTIRVSGYLESIHPLGNRNISIYIEDKHIATAVTNSEGYFSREITIPYIYREEVKLYASFTPLGSDIGRFKSSTSNIVKIKLLYTTPIIKAFIDRSYVKPLDKIYLVGLIEPRVPEVYVKAFNKHSTINVNSTGWFNTTLTVPDSIDEGTYTIIVGSYSLNTIAPSETTLKLTVYRLPSILTIKPPLIALSGFKTRLTGLALGGETPLGEANITLEIHGQTYLVATDSQGLFVIDIQTPHTVNTGFHIVKAILNPKEPWYRIAIVEESIFTLNPYMASAPIILALILLKTTIPKRRWEAEITPSTPIREPIKEAKPLPVGIARIYFEAVDIIMRITGIEMKPYNTIREYLTIVGEFLDGITDQFRELSYMAEAYLYGGIEPDMDKAMNLLKDIKGFKHD